MPEVNECFKIVNYKDNRFTSLVVDSYRITSVSYNIGKRSEGRIFYGPSGKTVSSKIYVHRELRRVFATEMHTRKDLAILRCSCENLVQPLVGISPHAWFRFGPELGSELWNFWSMVRQFGPAGLEKAGKDFAFAIDINGWMADAITPLEEIPLDLWPKSGLE